MLDRIFMSKLNSRGKAMYFIGQLVLLGILAAVIFGVMGLRWDGGGSTVFVIIGIISVLIWGGICIAVWPKDKAVATQQPEEPNNQDGTNSQ